MWWEKGLQRKGSGLVLGAVGVILQAEGCRNKRAPACRNAWQGLGPTQPRWHLLWEEEFQRHIQAAASDPRGINTQLTAELLHRKHLEQQSQGPHGDRQICLTK